MKTPTPKRPRDVNQLARFIVEQATGEKFDPVVQTPAPEKTPVDRPKGEKVKK